MCVYLSLILILRVIACEECEHVRLCVRYMRRLCGRSASVNLDCLSRVCGYQYDSDCQSVQLLLSTTTVIAWQSANVTVHHLAWLSISAAGVSYVTIYICAYISIHNRYIYICMGVMKMGNIVPRAGIGSVC